jgi:hypothetical protein
MKNDDNDEEDDSDFDDEELEDIDNEDITEDGIMLEQSTINSSDLYKMQSRIFGSNTSSNDLLSESDFTEQVRKAMVNVNRNKQMFSSEDQAILNMNSVSSEKLIKKKPKHNKKYH